MSRHREAVLALAARHGASGVLVCGSRARGEARPDSDADLYLEFGPGRGLLDAGALLMDLRELLGCEVELITPGSLRPGSRESVLGRAVRL